MLIEPARGRVKAKLQCIWPQCLARILPQSDEVQRVSKQDKKGRDQNEDGEDDVLEPLLEKDANRIAEIVEQSRDGKEPNRTCNRRVEDEKREGYRRDPGGDGNELERREETNDEDQPRVLGKSHPERVDLVRHAQRRHEPMTDGLVKDRADRIAERTADDR